jgi:PleD family two-component response regulator
LTAPGGENPPSSAMLYQAADDALRRAKAEGRNRSVGASM